MNKIGFINGTVTDQVLASQWDRCNSVVLPWILRSVTEDLYCGQIFSTNATEVWNELKETYDKIDTCIIFNLHQQINTLKQNDYTLSEYYHKFNTLWKQYDAMVSSPDCTCGTTACTCEAATSHKEHKKMIKLMQFLMGLSDEYTTIRSNILLRDSVLDVKEVYAIISREESHKGISNDKIGKTQASAFVTQANNTFNKNDNSSGNFYGNNNNNYNNRSSNQTLKCKKCNKLGHTIDRCFEIIGYPPSFRRKNNGNQSNNNNNNVNKSYANNSVTNKDESTSSAPASLTNEQLIKLLSLINDNIAPVEKNSNMAGNFVNHNLKLTVGHPNGTQAKVVKVGNLKLTNNVVLFDVLVVPEYYDLKAMTTLGTGSQSGGLYLFDMNVLCMTCNVCVHFISAQLWHARLGHPSDQEPFPLSDHKSQWLGDLIHLDLWGPFKIQSKEGYKYFLTIVDDFSRAVWNFLFKTKEDTFDNIQSFVNLIKNQFNKTVKVITSDNGTEFVNNKMNNFIKLNGIVHQTSCAYTPQQNGIAERKHRHLLNVARALMFQWGLPLNMWSDYILIACYLINMTPSSVLSGKTPYECVFKKDPSLSHLRCFGCLCYATVLNPENKFSSRSFKCVLIGFGNVQKGYKLLNLVNRSVLFSRDVRFFENIFPLKSKLVDNSLSDSSFDKEKCMFFDKNFSK
ncbi:uncharacterized protein [Rutidosis leptorrhynchoides]|uniref:uncharacterized protein n=1 Tax=Rutidosis leptorrhynchoides TaxID=125765 RepID=UPI003A9A33E1